MPEFGPGSTLAVPRSITAEAAIGRRPTIGLNPMTLRALAPGKETVPTSPVNDGAKPWTVMLRAVAGGEENSSVDDRRPPEQRHGAAGGRAAAQAQCRRSEPGNRDRADIRGDGDIKNTDNHRSSTEDRDGASIRLKILTHAEARCEPGDRGRADGREHLRACRDSQRRREADGDGTDPWHCGDRAGASPGRRLSSQHDGACSRRHGRPEHARRRRASDRDRTRS